MGFVITNSLVIPESEVRLTAVRSSGPGGQNVNKVNSRVVLEFDVKQSIVLNEGQKRKLLKGLGHRVNHQGVLRLQAQRHRTQSANRAAVIEKFILLLQGALRPAKVRVATTVPGRVREERIAKKKQRADIKRVRRKIDHDEE